MRVLKRESAERSYGKSLTAPPLRLTIDARAWKTGLGTYTLNLLRAMRGLDGQFRTKAIVPREAVEAVSGLCDETCVVDAPIYGLREQFLVARAARGSDLLHVPHYNIPITYRGPMVVTIHDLTHVTHPAFGRTAKSRLYARPIMKMAVKKASQVFTVSEHSRRQIVERLDAPAEKVTVTYPGVSSQFRPVERTSARARVRTALQVERPYLLFVGNLKPHKNLKTLIRAFALLHARHRIEHLLVVLGSDRKNGQAVLEECNKPELNGAVRNIPWAPQELMPHLYSAADSFVMPSTSEGFGSPVLEAMACGTPVACSNATSLPEVGGDAVVYFDPYSVKEMAEAVDKVISSPSLQAELREKGLKRAAKFTWEECARKHLEVYRRVAGA